MECGVSDIYDKTLPETRRRMGLVFIPLTSEIKTALLANCPTEEGIFTANAIFKGVSGAKTNSVPMQDSPGVL